LFSIVRHEYYTMLRVASGMVARAMLGNGALSKMKADDLSGQLDNGVQNVKETGHTKCIQTRCRQRFIHTW
jgi:hypothetical protein